MKNVDLMKKFEVSKDSFPEGDYVSPTFEHFVNVDSCFPQKMVGNVDAITNPLFRKHIEHKYFFFQNKIATNIILFYSILYQFLTSFKMVCLQ